MAAHDPIKFNNLIDAVHFVGVGGIGMSALAKLALERGLSVSGYDRRYSSEVEMLVRRGMVWIESEEVPPILTKTQKSWTPSDQDRDLPDPSRSIVVVSSAIDQTHPHVIEAIKQGKVWHRARFLSYLMLESKALGVMGCHGKTTTSAMLARALHHLNQNVTFSIGGYVAPWMENALRLEVKDKGLNYFVAECDESDGSFTSYFLNALIITNLDWDHPDFWKSHDQLLAAFRDYLHQYHRNESTQERFETFLDRDESCTHLRNQHSASLKVVVWCWDCPHLRRLFSELSIPAISYGRGEGADVRLIPTQRKLLCSKRVDFYTEESVLIPNSIVGEHNLLNATAVWTLLCAMGIDSKSAAEALKSFQGVARRMQRLTHESQLAVYDDYAHHPQEVQASLQQLLTKGCVDIRVIFQPHRWARLHAFYEEFTSAFKGASEVIVTDVYEPSPAASDDNSKMSPSPPREGFSDREESFRCSTLGTLAPPSIDYTHFCDLIMKNSDCKVRYLSNLDPLIQEIACTDTSLNRQVTGIDVQQNGREIVWIAMGAGDITLFAHQLADAINNSCIH